MRDVVILLLCSAFFLVVLWDCHRDARRKKEEYREEQIVIEAVSVGFYAVHGIIAERLRQHDFNLATWNDLRRICLFADREYEKFCGMLGPHSGCEYLLMMVRQGILFSDGVRERTRGGLNEPAD